MQVIRSIIACLVLVFVTIATVLVLPTSPLVGGGLLAQQVQADSTNPILNLVNGEHNNGVFDGSVSRLLDWEDQQRDNDIYRTVVVSMELPAILVHAPPVRRLNNNDDSSLNSGAGTCLLYTSPSPRDRTRSRMPSSA